MNIEIDWQEPIQLTRGKKVLVDKNGLPDRLENRPGVYFFGRTYGTLVEPFYIGETLDLRKRLIQHLGSTKIDHILRQLSDAPIKIKNGDRYFHFGYAADHSLEKAQKKIRIVQRYMIEQALYENFDIINKQLTRIKTHEIYFNGTKKSRGIYAKKVSVQRK